MIFYRVVRNLKLPSELSAEANAVGSQVQPKSTDENDFYGLNEIIKKKELAEIDAAKLEDILKANLEVRKTLERKKKDLFVEKKAIESKVEEAQDNIFAHEQIRALHAKVQSSLRTQLSFREFVQMIIDRTSSAVSEGQYKRNFH